MVYSNYHTHCFFCDGEGEPEEYVREAINQGFCAIGFSSHSPLPFSPWTMKEERVEEYINTINALKAKYKGVIEIYAGLEIDYIRGIYGPRSGRFNKLNLDYNIGSIHTIKCENTGEYLNVDGSAEEFEKMLDLIFEGSMERFVQGYYGLVREMIEIHSPDIIGHLDLIKKNNRGGRYFNEDEIWYRDEVLKTLNTIAGSSCILEVNTGGMSRKYTDTFYPSPWILEECSRLCIPVMINADAHSPKNIGAYFNEAASALKDAGYTKQRILYNGKWTDAPL